MHTKCSINRNSFPLLEPVHIRKQGESLRMSFPWETKIGTISGVAEKAKKKEPSVPFNPYRIPQGKNCDLQFGNKYTKAFLRLHRSSTPELSYLHTYSRMQQARDTSLYCI